MADPVPAVAPAPAPPAAPPAPAAARSPAAPAKVDQATYDRMSIGERYQYARQFPQPGGDAPPAGADANPVAQRPAPGDTPPGPAAVTPDGKLRIGEGGTAYELSGDDVRMLMAQKAEGDLRKTRIPPDPSGYQLKLREGFALPDGVQMQFDEADPASADLRRFAHAKGWSQDDLSDVLGVYTSREVRQLEAHNAAQAREVAKLGVNGTTRVTAIETWLRAQVGDDLANSMRSMIVSAKIIEGFERIASKQTTQGAANFSQAHRAPPENNGPGRVDEATYNRMSQAEKWEYARSFDQSQFRNNGGGSR